MKEIA